MVAFARTRWPAHDDAHLFACQDANYNVTALVRGHADDAMLGQVAERYVYEPYGAVTVYNGGGDMDFQERTDWSLDSNHTSDWGNTILYCGYRFDPETGLYDVRHRVLHPTLGRWTSRDPIGYADGMSLYGYVRCRPTTLVDPLGLHEVLGWYLLRERDIAWHDTLAQFWMRVKVWEDGGQLLAEVLDHGARKEQSASWFGRGEIDELHAPRPAIEDSTAPFGCPCKKIVWEGRAVDATPGDVVLVTSCAGGADLGIWGALGGSVIAPGIGSIVDGAIGGAVGTYIGHELAEDSFHEVTVDFEVAVTACRTASQGVAFQVHGEETNQGEYFWQSAWSSEEDASPVAIVWE